MKRVAIIGGGPAALMTYKNLADAGKSDWSVDIFEATNTLGSGMPYSDRGAEIEHITNVSSDELPDLLKSLENWVKALPSDELKKFGIDREEFHEKKVLPRLLFGRYLAAQFQGLIEEGRERGIETTVHYEAAVIDLRDDERKMKVVVTLSGDKTSEFDVVVICSGHSWLTDRENTVAGYFDSPYPPSKLASKFNHTVIIRGSSLTAVDAIRTISKHNGHFSGEGENRIFELNADSPNFEIIMHSRHGMLPCIRVHMEEPHVAGAPLISPEAIDKNIRENSGFLELDFLFEQGFKLPLKESDLSFYEKIKDMSLETFVEKMMDMRERIEPFELFAKEYREAKASIRKERPVYWKEMLSALSFAMNYPAKYLSAEDMLRLKKHLMPLISVVIAFIPQSSCESLIALHAAGRLTLIADSDGGEAKISESGKITYHYQDEDGVEHEDECKTFIDCVGQRQLPLDAFPFKSLVNEGTISGARLKFRSPERARELLSSGDADVEEIDGEYFLKVPGADVSDNFQVVDKNGHASERVYLMAVPYMGGFNPDYSGLDFCEHASEKVVASILGSTNKLKSKVNARV